MAKCLLHARIVRLAQEIKVEQVLPWLAAQGPRLDLGQAQVAQGECGSGCGTAHPEVLRVVNTSEVLHLALRLVRLPVGEPGRAATRKKRVKFCRSSSIERFRMWQP